MRIFFDQPAFLLLALASIPLVAAGWRLLAGMDRLRRCIVLACRALLVVALAVALARPATLQTHDRVTVMGLLDLSGSVRHLARLDRPGGRGPGSNVAYLRDWLTEAVRTRRTDDRFGLVVFDGEAIAMAVPRASGELDFEFDLEPANGTDIEAAWRLGVAMFPADTAKRVALVSDGNETQGDLLRAVRESTAIERIPIDVLPIDYVVDREVQVVRVEAPPRAQPGQTIALRVILESTAPTRGRLLLRREGEAIDLDRATPGASRAVDVPAGRSVHVLPVPLAATPVNRFEASFEPDDPASDRFRENNRAEAVVAAPSRGAVLIVTRDGDAATNALAPILTAAGLPVEVRSAEGLPGDLLRLQNYDLLVLDNVSAGEIARPQHALIARYVNDLGGGLMMVGGETSFGAGGWNGSPLEEVLPVELDPTLELRVVSAALVLVLDRSGSMAQRVAGARATQQAIANEAAALAIESLRSDSLVGVVVFDSAARTLVPLQMNSETESMTRAVRRIAPNGGTNLAPALRRAHEMLRDANAQRKHVVCLSDGRSMNPQRLDGIVKAMAGDGIVVTTIAVGDDADDRTLEQLAATGGGEFHAVRNPRTLPRVLVDSVQVLNKPLIKEGLFTPLVETTGSRLTVGWRDVPPLGGLVVTAAKPDPGVVVELVHPEGEPLLAHWFAGLGRVAAFTSDYGGPWSTRWVGWTPAAAFWPQLARMVARPVMQSGAELRTEIRDGRLEITYDAGGLDAARRERLTVDGSVYRPDGSSRPVTLRQTLPGRYETSLEAQAPGTYVVALSPRDDDRRLAPAIGGTSLSTSLEYRRYTSNPELLDEVRRLTGGRRLNVDDPREADLFDRTGMRESVSVLPAWRWWMIASLVLLLLDVAARRLAWSAALFELGWRRATRRVTPRRATSPSLAAAARRRRERRTRTPRPAGPAASSSEDAPPAEPAPAPRPRERPAPEPAGEAPPKKPKPDRDEPSPDERREALDILRGRKGRSQSQQGRGGSDRDSDDSATS